MQPTTLDNLFITGPSPYFTGSSLLKGRRFVNGMDTISLAGCLDAPDFIPTGAVHCELSIAIFTRDEIADQEFFLMP